MYYQEAKSAILSVLKKAPHQALFLLGAPGTAKTSLCFDIAKDLSMPTNRVLLFRPSLREPVDLMGVPIKTKANTAKWATPEEFYEFREGSGKGMIIWDELPQGITQMQNAIAGALLDKVLGPLHLDKDVIQIATGNRTIDKAGANRIVSQLGNRVMTLEVEPHLDDWCKWAASSGIDPYVIGFIRSRPDLLHDLNPNHMSNPTPRSWEMVSNACDLTLPRGVLFNLVKGLVGEAAAVEFCAYADLLHKVTTFDQVILDPLKAPIPDHPAVKFATITGLAYRASPANYSGLMNYIERLPKEFQVAFVKDSLERDRAITGTKAFTNWCIQNPELFK
jgi:hypothetical protein